MHGFITKGLLCYIRDVHGKDALETVSHQTQIDLEAPDLYTETRMDLAAAVLDATSKLLDRSEDDILEDVGTYFVCHPNTTGLRHLMRFSGRDFEDFLAALPDLAPRVAMAVPGMMLPRIDVSDTDDGIEVYVYEGIAGYQHVITGTIRAMADDYGALVHVAPVDRDMTGRRGQKTCLLVRILDAGFDSGRAFSLLEVTA